jgi:hypothetical protein
MLTSSFLQYLDVVVTFTPTSLAALSTMTVV